MKNNGQNTGVENGKKYVLKLFITGSTPRSINAINNISTICKNYLDDDYVLQIIDMYENPELAREDHIVAIPTLIKVLPHPARKLVGDMAQTDKVLSGLGLI